MRWNVLLLQVLGMISLGCSSGQGTDGSGGVPSATGGSPGAGGGPSGADPEFAAWDPYPGPCVETRYRKNVQLDDGPTDVVEEDTYAYELDDLGLVSTQTVNRTYTLVDGTSEVRVISSGYVYEDSVSVCSGVQPPLRFEATSCPSGRGEGTAMYSYNSSGQLIGIGGDDPLTYVYRNGLPASYVWDFGCGSGGGWVGEFEWLSSHELTEVAIWTDCTGAIPNIRAERLYHYDERGNLVMQEELLNYVDTGEVRGDAEITYDYTCWEN